MKLRLALAALALVLPGAALAQDDSGQMINDPNPANFSVWGVQPAPKSVKDESVQGGRSVHVPVTGKGNPWDISVNVPITSPIRSGDRLTMMFYAKLEKPENGATSARINAAQVQLAAAPYSVVFGEGVDITPEWKLFTVEGRADKDYAKGTLNATFHLNVGDKHTVAMGVVAVFDKGQ